MPLSSWRRSEVLEGEGYPGPLQLRLAKLLVDAVGKEIETTCFLESSEPFGGTGILEYFYTDLSRPYWIFIGVDYGMAWAVNPGVGLQLKIDGQDVEIQWNGLQPCIVDRQLTNASCGRCGRTICNDCAMMMQAWESEMFCPGCANYLRTELASEVLL